MPNPETAPTTSLGLSIPTGLGTTCSAFELACRQAAAKAVVTVANRHAAAWKEHPTTEAARQEALNAACLSVLRELVFLLGADVAMADLDWVLRAQTPAEVLAAQLSAELNALAY